MNLIKKIAIWLKNKFHKQEEQKPLPEPSIILDREKEQRFRDSLKVTTQKKKKTKIETATCPGDGLGIQGPMTY